MTNDAKLPHTGVYYASAAGRFPKTIDLKASLAGYRKSRACCIQPSIHTLAARTAKNASARIFLQGLERVLIAGCAPRLVEKLFREAAGSAGPGSQLRPYCQYPRAMCFSHPGNPAQAVKTQLA
jgi:heterodisulfide reductase subunit A-like polyferredoxin